MGGRTSGTTNKTSATVRQAISKMLDEYYNSETFQNDMSSLEPRDRVAAMERLAAYAVPKLQSTTLDVAVESKKTIEDRLSELSGEE